MNEEQFSIVLFSMPDKFHLKNNSNHDKMRYSESSDRMQKKMNILLWTFIPCLVIFFIGLSIWNQGKMKKYELSFLWDEHTIQISVFDSGSKDWNRVLETIKRKKFESANTVLEDISKLLNTKRYIIQLDDDIMVGSYYAKGKYKVATTYKSGDLFEVMSLENESLITTEVEHDEFDKLIVLAPNPSVAYDLTHQLTSMSLTDASKIVRKQEGVVVYWLHGNTEISKIKGIYK